MKCVKRSDNLIPSGGGGEGKIKIVQPYMEKIVHKLIESRCCQCKCEDCDSFRAENIVLKIKLKQVRPFFAFAIKRYLPPPPPDSQPPLAFELEDDQCTNSSLKM